MEKSKSIKLASARITIVCRIILSLLRPLSRIKGTWSQLRPKILHRRKKRGSQGSSGPEAL